MTAPAPALPAGTTLETLLYFDQADAEAALVVARDQQQSVRCWKLGRHHGGDAREHVIGRNSRLSHIYLLVGGYDPLARQVYAVRITGQLEAIGTTGVRVSSRPSPARMVVVSAAGIREVGPALHVRGYRSDLAYDPERRRLVLLEYGEHPYGSERPPRGYLVEPTSGRTLDFEIPAAAYAAAFTADGRRLLVNGFQRGVLWEIDLDSGRQLRARRTGAGWSLGQLDPRSLLLVRNGSIDLLDARGLTLRRRWQLGRLLPRDAHHTQGSLVLGSELVVSLWGDLHLLRLPRGP